MTDTKDTPSSAAQTSLSRLAPARLGRPRRRTPPLRTPTRPGPGAHHRVRFDQETFQIAFYVEHDGNDFYYEYFGADGWPLFVPEKLKSNLDNRCREDLHRFPLLVAKRCWNERSLKNLRGRGRVSRKTLRARPRQRPSRGSGNRAHQLALTPRRLNGRRSFSVTPSFSHHRRELARGIPIPGSSSACRSASRRHCAPLRTGLLSPYARPHRIPLPLLQEPALRGACSSKGGGDQVQKMPYGEHLRRVRFGGLPLPRLPCPHRISLPSLKKPSLSTSSPPEPHP